jgi:Sec7-like guanine-nucleotide exchange factor
VQVTNFKKILLILVCLDAAYVLAYSTVLLNTDQYNPQVKKRMSKAEFIRNNRGINDGADLPEDFLSEIFDEIAKNEIRMKDEVEAAAGSVTATVGIAGALANVGRDLQREAYLMKSSGMANKTEASVYECPGAGTRLSAALGIIENHDAITSPGIEGGGSVLQRVSFCARSSNVRGCLDTLPRWVIQPFARYG